MHVLAEVGSFDVVLPTDTGIELRLRTTSLPGNHLPVRLDKRQLPLPNKPKTF